jgi:hypothetical protein
MNLQIALALLVLTLNVVHSQVVKVFVIAGQSNAEGHAEVASKNKTTGKYLNGTLAYQLTDPRTSELFSPLWDTTTQNWTILSDIKIWYNEIGSQSGVNGSNIPSKPGDAAFGDLTVGYGALANPNLIGPELGFGFGMKPSLNPGDKYLVMKTAWGGKDLAQDYRPPSSVSNFDVYCQEAPCVNQVGHYYQVMVEDIHKMLVPGAVSAMFPDLAGLQVQFSGFGWFQGWNDGCDLNMTAAYEWNMVNLIKDLRTEFNSPTLPISIAVAGFDGFNGAENARHPPLPVPWIDATPSEKIGTDCSPLDHGCRRLDIALSQLAAGNSTRHPELNGHVSVMETRGFWRDPQYSPNQAEGYHYWHNAETAYLVGLAMAQGMLAAMN